MNMPNYLFHWLGLWQSYLDRFELLHSKLSSVVCFGKLITVISTEHGIINNMGCMLDVSKSIHEESSAHYIDCFANHQVLWGEPFLDLVIRYLHHSTGKVGCVSKRIH